MTWFLLGILSALFLGCYDVSKKLSLTDNRVITVLTLSVCISSLLLLPMLVLSRTNTEMMQQTIFFVPKIDLRTHLYILLKSVIVLSSWVFAYMAMKHLPLTIVTPINATRPMWTLVGALIIFGEQLNSWQWAGVVVCLLSFYAFSLVGKKEGVSFVHNRWIWALIAGTLLGASSGLYDKYLMHKFDHNAVQVFYTFYQAALMLVVWIVDSLRHHKTIKQSVSSVNWHWSIALISVFLVASDFVYLLALTYPDSLISVLSAVRRSGVVVSFLFGIFVLHDKNPRLKTLCLIGVMIGILLLFIGS